MRWRHSVYFTLYKGHYSACKYAYYDDMDVNVQTYVRYIYTNVRVSTCPRIIYENFITKWQTLINKLIRNISLFCHKRNMRFSIVKYY